MCWLGIRQLTVVGIAEYADILEQLYWKGIIYPSGIRLRETLGIRKLAHAGNWSLRTASFGHFYRKPSYSAAKPRKKEVIDCNETLLSPSSKPAFLATSCTSSPRDPAILPDPRERSRMLPAQLCMGRQDAVLAALCLVPSLSGPHCASSLPSDNSVLKTPGKRRRFRMRNVTLEAPTTSDHRRSCCAFHENSSSPGQTPVCVTAFIG